MGFFVIVVVGGCHLYIVLVNTDRKNWKHHGLDSIKGRSIIQYFNIFDQHDNSGVSLTVLLTAQIEFFTGIFFPK